MSLIISVFFYVSLMAILFVMGLCVGSLITYNYLKLKYEVLGYIDFGGYGQQDPYDEMSEDELKTLAAKTCDHCDVKSNTIKTYNTKINSYDLCSRCASIVNLRDKED